MGRRGQQRPSVFKRVLVIGLALVLVLPIVGYFTVPAVKQAIDGLIKRGSVALALQQNPSSNAVDGEAATVWLADPTGAPPTVTATFTGTTDLAGMIFQTGAGSGAEYASHARPRQMELVFLGDARPVTFELADNPAPQKYCLRENHEVRSLEIRILTVYPPAPGGQNLVGIRDIEFRSGSC